MIDNTSSANEIHTFIIRNGFGPLSITQCKTWSFQASEEQMFEAFDKFFGEFPEEDLEYISTSPLKQVEKDLDALGFLPYFAASLKTWAIERKWEIRRKAAGLI